MKRIIYVFILFALLGISINAQKSGPSKTAPNQPAKPPSKIAPNTTSEDKPLTNADIIKMVKSGFNDTVILNAIQINKTEFDLSMDGLFQLKNGGVSQKVIETMQSTITDRKNSSSPSATTNASTKTGEKRNAAGDDLAEIQINADADSIRATIIRRFTKDKFDFDKDQPNQLVFSKEVRGVTGFIAGTLLGRDQNNPRQIVTFILTKSGKGFNVLARVGIIYPNDNGQGNARQVDSKKIRKELLKVLGEIKEESEK